VFDAVVHELATGPLQAGTDTTPGRVTIGWGRQDRLLLPRQAHRAEAAFPKAQLHWFDRSGHFPHWDQPDERFGPYFRRPPNLGSVDKVPNPQAG
jgi:pimeloyl-ACP methyl ester carboxylesterase